MEFEVGKHEIQLIKVEKQILYPEAGTLADGNELCRLKMRVAKGRKGTVLHSKGGERFYHGDKLAPYIAQSVTVDDEISIVGDIAARCAEVYYACGIGAAFAIDMDMRHDVVAQQLFLCGDGVVVDIVEHMRFKLRHLFGGDRKPQHMLCTRQCDPELTPGMIARVGRKQLQHIGRGVA